MTEFPKLDIILRKAKFPMRLRIWMRKRDKSIKRIDYVVYFQSWKLSWVSNLQIKQFRIEAITSFQRFKGFRIVLHIPIQNLINKWQNFYWSKRMNYLEIIRKLRGKDLHQEREVESLHSHSINWHLDWFILLVVAIFFFWVHQVVPSLSLVIQKS